MLPMFDHKKIVSVIASKRGKNPDVEVAAEVEAPGQEMDPALKAAAEDILRAISTKSVIDLAKALRAAYEVCESYPHEDNSQAEMSEDGE